MLVVQGCCWLIFAVFPIYAVLATFTLPAATVILQILSHLPWSVIPMVTAVCSSRSGNFERGERQCNELCVFHMGKGDLLKKILRPKAGRGSLPPHPSLPFESATGTMHYRLSRSGALDDALCHYRYNRGLHKPYRHSSNISPCYNSFSHCYYRYCRIPPSTVAGSFSFIYSVAVHKKHGVIKTHDICFWSNWRKE